MIFGLKFKLVLLTEKAKSVKQIPPVILRTLAFDFGKFSPNSMSKSAWLITVLSRSYCLTLALFHKYLTKNNTKTPNNKEDIYEKGLIQWNTWFGYSSLH